MTVTVKTAKGTSADPSVFTEATETNATSYRLRNLMNQPSQCVVTVNDPDFASWQKYSTKGEDTYFGLYSRVKITDTEIAPTTVFNGPVVRVVGNPRAGTLELHCRDWLHQLATRRIVYDTREDLDGSGLRESTCYNMDTAVPVMHGIIDSGAAYRLYDTVAGWSENDWTGSTHYLLFSGKMGGTGNFWQAISAVTLTDCGNENGTDFGYSWLLTRAPWEVEGDNNLDDIEIVADVGCNIDGAKVTRVDVTFRYMVLTTQSSEFTIDVYESDTPGYQEIFADDDLSGEFKDVTITDIAALLGLANSDIIDTTNHRLRFKLQTDMTGAAKAYLWLWYFRVTIHYEGAGVNTTAYTIDDDGDDYVEVSEDLPGARLDKHSPYMIIQPITVYVADLVTTYDVSTTLDASTDLVASTNVLARHYHYNTPLQILKDLAAADGTEFWLDEDLHLHWNDPYTVNGTTVTDADVLYWVNPTIGVDQGFANRVVVLGQRTVGAQVSKEYTDDAPGGPFSENWYGSHTLVETNPGIYTQTDANSYAEAIFDRLEVPAVHVSYAVMGSGAGAKGWRDIGDVVKINSTDLGLTNEWYVVTETRFDSSTGIQDVFLAPRATDGLFRQQQILDGTRWVRETLEDTRRNMSFDPLQTETW